MLHVRSRKCFARACKCKFCTDIVFYGFNKMLFATYCPKGAKFAHSPANFAALHKSQSRSSSLIPVLLRVWASTVFTITAQ